MKRETFSDKVFIVCNYAFLFVLLLIVLYPLVYIVSASISDPVKVGTGEMWLLPKGLTFEGYERVFANKDIWRGYGNTIFYTLLGVLINLLLTIPCAYALSRRNLFGRDAITIVIIATMFFSGGMIPTYLLVKDLGMMNSVWAMVVPSAVSVWNLVVARTFFSSTIPIELEEAAQVDGCSYFRLFLIVVLPLSKPIIAVMALFYGVTHWNQFFQAMLYLHDRELFPLQLVLREILIISEIDIEMIGSSSESMDNLQRQARIAEIMKYAAMMVSSLPLFVVYPFIQRYFVQGVLIGSLKG